MIKYGYDFIQDGQQNFFVQGKRETRCKKIYKIATTSSNNAYY